VRPDTPFVRSPESSDDEAKGRSPRDLHQLNPTASTPPVETWGKLYPFLSKYLLSECLNPQTYPEVLVLGVLNIILDVQSMTKNMMQIVLKPKSFLGNGGFNSMTFGRPGVLLFH